MTDTAATAKTRPCPRCSGKGEIVGFRHRLNGLCFLCNGKGTRPALKGHTRKPGERIKTRKPRGSQSDQLWNEFEAQHPAEAHAIRRAQDADPSDPVAGTAYSSVATYTRQASNPAQALRLAASLPECDCPFH